MHCGNRITAFITDIPDRVITGKAAGREPNHRQHARVEDRIREAKNTGLRNLPCRGWEENVAWLETLLAATDLVCWAKLLGVPGATALAYAEIETFRNLVPHVAARLTRSARQVHLRMDRTWKHADAWFEDPRRVHLNSAFCSRDPKDARSYRLHSRLACMFAGVAGRQPSKIN